MATLALKSRLLRLVCFDHILQRPPPQKRLDGALTKTDFNSTFLKVTVTDGTTQLSKC